VKSIVKRKPSGGKIDMSTVKTVRTSDRNTYTALKAVLNLLPADIGDVIKDREMTYTVMNRMNSAVRAISSGIWSSFPMICCGAKCPYGGRCPLQHENVPPVGSDCPLEQYMMRNWMAAYVDALIVETDNKIEMDQVGEIVMCDLMIMRVRNWMARRGDGHAENHVVGIDDNGNVILRRGVSTEVEIEDKYSKKKDKLLKALLATREARAKYKVATDTDIGVKQARIMEKVRTLKDEKGPWEDADFEVVVEEVTNASGD